MCWSQSVIGCQTEWHQRGGAYKAHHGWSLLCQYIMPFKKEKRIKCTIFQWNEVKFIKWITNINECFILFSKLVITSNLFWWAYSIFTAVLKVIDVNIARLSYLEPSWVFSVLIIHKCKLEVIDMRKNIRRLNLKSIWNKACLQYFLIH